MVPPFRDQGPLPTALHRADADCMPTITAIRTVGETVLNAAKTLCSVACCSRVDCVAAQAAVEVQDLVVDLTRHGFHAGKLDDLATWLPDHDWLPAMWGIHSAVPQVQMAACCNALRVVVAKYDDVLIDRHIPAGVAAFLARQREAVSAMDLRLRAAITAPAYTP